MQEFKDAFSVFPWYVYVVLAGCSLALGAWLRKYFDRKEAARQKQAKVELREMKKEAKRAAKIRKRKARGRKPEQPS